MQLIRPWPALSEEDQDERIECRGQSRLIEVLQTHHFNLNGFSRLVLGYDSLAYSTILTVKGKEHSITKTITTILYIAS